MKCYVITRSPIIHRRGSKDKIIFLIISFGYTFCYGSQWLEGRLVCVVSKSSVQPFLARGWSSWGTDEETTEEFAQVSVPVKGSVTLRAVVDQGIPTVGDPAELGLEDMCADSWRWISQNPNGFEVAVDAS